MIPALLLMLGVVGSARAQFLVYELTFEVNANESVNFQFYSGAYVVAPLDGGAASLILTTEEGGYFYSCAPEAARFFFAANPQSQQVVLSALALNGSAQALYTARGAVNHTLTLPQGENWRAYRVAQELQGRLIAADDDSASGPLADGSLGMVGTAVIHGVLREDLTTNANQFATQTDAMWYLVGLLERYGYVAEGGQARPAADESTDAPSEASAEVVDPAVYNPLFPSGAAEEAERQMEAVTEATQMEPRP
ncbi:MAG: hypothetical protein KDK99_13675 [Verrucomicrobiales bacterium]|nr:hypothetical protein [Verrucomicrobiales bacterium]